VAISTKVSDNTHENKNHPKVTCPMKKLILFLLAILLLSACSPAVVELPTSMPIPPTATQLLPTAIAVPTSTPISTITLTPSFVSPTPYPKVSKCTLISDLYLLLPDGNDIYAEYSGWTSDDEFYLGGYSQDGLVFCFLDKGFTGHVEEFNRQTDSYVASIPENVLSAIEKEGLFEIFSSPDENKYLYVRAADNPRFITEYDVWMWNQEKQEDTLILDTDNEFWRYCGGFMPPENINWLDGNLLFVD
jgi:Prokaryotic membrane lipoprotein lipid attachment site